MRRATVSDLVIAGAGPQALSLCCQLLQKRPYWRRRVRILDPSGRWLSRWERQMRQFEIPWLRSPSPHHPHPNPNALRSYAQRGQRSDELEGPYGQPHTGLFNTFCLQVIEEFDLANAVEPLTVESVELGQSQRDPLELTLSDGTQQEARHLVLATGPATPVLPSWMNELEDGAHPTSALQHSQDVDFGACADLDGQDILIVGGGLTSAHLCLGAIKRGARVILLIRRNLPSKPFDADPGWLGPKYLKDFQRETSWRQRLRSIQRARDGGSITPALLHALRQEQRSGRLALMEHCEVQQACWIDGRWCVQLQGDGGELFADRLWLATGHHGGVSRHPLAAQLQAQRPIHLVDDWPVLGEDLCWPETSVHLMGALASLQLGPAARNLYGGREAAKRICRSLIKSR